MNNAELVDGVLRRETRFLAKAISTIEQDAPEGGVLLKALATHLRGPPVFGFVGPPGSGKSTLIGKVVQQLLSKGLKTAVLAIDPSSPVTGGAVLGDRVRMTFLAGEKDVFIRSMATRGSRSVVSSNVKAVLRVLDAAGFDVLVVETAGAGQTDFSVQEVADVVVVVVTPDMGDSVQAIKAGLFEVGDIYVVNKSDDPRASFTAAMLQAHLRRKTTSPTVLKTDALRGNGVTDLVENMLETYSILQRSGELANRRRKQLVAEVRQLMSERLNALLEKYTQEEPFVNFVEKMVAEKGDPRLVAGEILTEILRQVVEGR